MALAKAAKEANAATKHAEQVGTKQAHLTAAKLHAIYADQVEDRMLARNQGYSRTLGYHSDMETYHKLKALGREAAMPRRYNPRNDPASMSYQFQRPYYD